MYILVSEDIPYDINSTEYIIHLSTGLTIESYVNIDENCGCIFVFTILLSYNVFLFQYQLTFIVSFYKWYTMYLFALFTINSAESILPTIMLSFLFIPGISTHDGSSLIPDNILYYFNSKKRQKSMKHPE